MLGRDMSAPSPTFRLRAGLVKPRAGFVVLGYALWATVIPLVALAIATGVPPIALGTIHSVLFGTMALSYGYRSTKNARVERGDLTVTDGALGFGGERLATRDELKQGFLIPDGVGAFVRLERKSRLAPAIVLRVEREAEGQELLRALGFDAGHSAAELRIASGIVAMPVANQLLLLLLPVLGFAVSVVAIGALLHAAGGPFVVLMIVMLMTWIFGLAFTPTKVRIGTDGIVTRWLGRERFIPHASVKAFAVYDEIVGTKRQHGVKLTTPSGEEIRLPTGQTDLGAAEAARLHARIREARDAGSAGNAAVTSLLRGGRSARAWLQALRAAGSEGAQGLRVPAVPHETLLRVVEDASADETARVSAAIAALASDDESTKQRVRVAAEVSASPKLRVALDRIVESASDDELAEVLDAIEGSQK